MEKQEKSYGPFEARIFIQGVANYVPHTDGDRLLVLFPNQDRYHSHPFPAVPPPPPGDPAPPDEICDHQAVIQMDIRHLVGDVKADHERVTWASIQLEGHWIGFETGGKGVPFACHPEGGVPCVPELESLLDCVGLGNSCGIDPSVLPRRGQLDPHADHVSAGVYVDQGVVSSASEFEGAFSFHEISSVHTSMRNVHSLPSLIEDEIFSGVLRIELGSIEELSIVVRAFGSSTVAAVPLQPVGDTLDVWIRHFCDLRPPDPERKTESGVLVDHDFRLNYLLRSDLPDLLVRAGNRLPIPRAAATWLRGGPIGGEPIKCMGSASRKAVFDSPLLGEAFVRKQTRPSQAR